MGIRDRAIAAGPARVVSEPFAAPWKGEDGEDEMIAVRDLGSEARIAFMSGVDASSGTVSMNPLVPYVTDLIVDPASGEPVFEIADHDLVIEKYPSVVSKAIMTAITISELGDIAAAAAEGNS